MTECNVSVDGDISGCEYEAYSCHIEAAKQDTICCECGTVIGTGEPREIAKGTWIDGEEHEHDTCLICAEIADAFVIDRSHGSLWDGLEAAFGDDPYSFTSGCLKKLKTAGAKKIISDFWWGCVFGKTEGGVQ